MSKREMNFRVSVRRGYGGGDAIEWSIEMEKQVSGQLEIRQTFENMTAMINSMLDLHENEQGLKNVGGNPSYHPANDKKFQELPTTERVSLDRLIVEILQGKKRLKLAGGKYGKWGVPIYEETWDQLGELANAAPGEHKVSGSMEVELEGGKPRRVKQVTIDVPF